MSKKDLPKDRNVTDKGYKDIEREGYRDEVAIPVIEEQAELGKRGMEKGGVRVNSRITETPVEGEINLREEHVNVERRPVDRPLQAGDVENFREGSLEVREYAEKPVVSKEARVKEEVVIGKEATERTETVRDSVKRTDVDIEKIDTTIDDGKRRR
jgi:uncharacterized protein (TIGR02271 family)